MLRDTPEGVVLPVTVTPRAKQEKIVGWHNGRLKIKVCAPPEKGEANRDVVRLLSKTLGVAQNRIVLLKGATMRQKEFLLMQCTQTDVSVLAKNDVQSQTTLDFLL